MSLVIPQIYTTSGDEFADPIPAVFSLLGKTGVSANASTFPVIVSTSILPVIGFAEDYTGESVYSGEAVTMPDVEVTVRLTAAVVAEEDPEVEELTLGLPLISSVADKLYSTDDRLRKHESDIKKYVAEGRATHKDTHRRVQQLIIAWLDTQSFVDDFGKKITKKTLLVTDDLAEWATMMALRLIFESNSNATDDVFAEKAKRYERLEIFYRNRAVLHLDLNEDGKVDITEAVDTRSCRVVRR